MNKLICLILGFAFLGSFAEAHLSNEFIDRYQVFALSRDSEFFREIESVTEEIILQSDFSQFCELMWHPNLVQIMTGVGEAKAQAIFKSCDKFRGKNRFVGIRPKIFAREFYVAYDPTGKSPVQSWTTYDNKTVIFVDPEFSRSKLRHVLAHELAISVDGKTNMMYATYLLYQDKGYDIGDKRFIVMGDLSREEELLQKRFNIATHRQISFTFAAIRATMAERLFIGKEKGLPFEMRYHDNCKQAFLTIYEALKKYPEVALGEGAGGFSDLMTSFMEQNANSIGIENAIKEVLDDKLTFKDRGDKVTFCTYMARPSFSPKSVYSLFAAGPRPKVTGGWSPEMRERMSKNPKDPRDAKSIYDSIKRDMKDRKAVQIEKLRSAI